MSRFPVAVAAAHILFLAPLARAEPGKCELEISGDFASKVTVTDPGRPRDPLAPGMSAHAATDYWMTEAELRMALSALNGALASTKTLLHQKGVGATRGDIEKAALKGAKGPTSDEREKQTDEAMKKDPRLMLLLMACRSDTVRLTLAPASKSKYANVPFKPARYSLVPDASAKPGDFVAMLLVQQGGQSAVYHVASPGRLELTQFDTRGITGTFSFSAEQAYGKRGQPPKKLALKGSFSFPCVGGSVCKK
jgi:hypothetical protein